MVNLVADRVIAGLPGMCLKLIKGDMWMGGQLVEVPVTNIKAKERFGYR